MSSGFVSGGTADQPTERDDEWLQAQKDIENTRRRKEEESRQSGGKTLYEVLQQNKAAKQEAFEESIRLKNQFRNLDEDEIEFLDSVLESTRAKEEAVKKETTEKLDVFRRQQEEADKALLAQEVNLNDRSPSNKAGNLPSDEAQWTITGRKRKRAKEKEVLKGVKLRKSSTSDSAVLDAESREISPILTKGETTSVQSHTKPGEAAATQKAELHIHGIHENSTKSLSTIENGTKSGLGLAGYSSDDED